MADMDSLRATFFEECEDLLSRMGEDLARLSEADSAPDIETIHSVFRAVHSVKGGAAAFGLAALVGFAHSFETVLDGMRSGRMVAAGSTVQTLLRAYDVLSDLVAAARDGGEEPAQAQLLLRELEALAGAHGDPDDAADGFDFQPLPLDPSVLAGPPDAADPQAGSFGITLAPTHALYVRGHEPAAILRSLARLGDLAVRANMDSVPPLAELDLAHPSLGWQMTLTGTSRAAIDEVFEFLDDTAGITVTGRAPDGPEGEAGSATAQANRAPQPRPARNAADGGNVVPFAPTIRVNLDRVDRLINQIGELAIMEAMLSQAATSRGLRDDSDFVGRLDGIKQLAAAIQESVMSIRAQPLKPVFQRMQRILREACDATGKQVRLQMQGEATEVDKTVIERLVDPLTHMIRNAIDHGIEAPALRSKAGKSTEGLITLSAAHRSGRVVIEVSDDGGGIDRARVREVAEDRGLIPANAPLTPPEIDNLLFLPGFSSRQEVSALSGRGVGLDVVRREIQSLGGRVTIQSVPGRGTTFTIALPLTLAVLEGMLIDVGGETMVIPLSTIIETLRTSEGQVHRLGRGGRLIANRGELIPVIDLCETFGFTPTATLDEAVLILVECDSGQRAALVAGTIHDQRQVVIKSIEDNYGSVRGVSSATILGDGRIALIIDPEEIVRNAAADAPSRSLSAHG